MIFEDLTRAINQAKERNIKDILVRKGDVRLSHVDDMVLYTGNLLLVIFTLWRSTTQLPDKSQGDLFLIINAQP